MDEFDQEDVVSPVASAEFDAADIAPETPTKAPDISAPVVSSPQPSAEFDAEDVAPSVADTPAASSEFDAADIVPSAASAPDLTRRLERKQDLIDKLTFLQRGTETDTPDENGLTIAQARKKVESSQFNTLPEEDVNAAAQLIEDKYRKAARGQTLGATIASAAKRGYESMGAMTVAGARMLKPGELSAEDQALIEAGSKASQEMATAKAPKAIGGVQDVRGIGDAMKFAAESIVENAPRALPVLAAATAGGIVGGSTGANVASGLGGLAQNVGEAAFDQAEEGRISKVPAIVQGAGYSLVDALIGGESALARKMTMRPLQKTAAAILKRDFIGSLKQLGKEVVKTGVKEAISEPVQSQVVGRAVRKAQTGSALRAGESPSDAVMEGINEAVGGFLGGIGLGGVGNVQAYRRNVGFMARADEAIGKLAQDADVAALKGADKLLVRDYMLGMAMHGDEGNADNKAKIEAGLEDIYANLDDSAKAVVDTYRKIFTDVSVNAVPDTVKPTFAADAAAVEAGMVDEGNGVRVFAEPQSGIVIEERNGQYVVSNANGLKMPLDKNAFFDAESAVTFAQDLSRLNEFRKTNNAAKARFIESVAKRQFPNARVVSLDSADQLSTDELSDPKLRATALVSNGFYNPKNNTVYVFLDNIRNPAQAVLTLRHEDFHRQYTDWAKATGRAPVSEASEEAMATAYETRFSEPTRWERIKNGVAAWIKDTTGVNAKPTDGDMRRLMNEVAEARKRESGTSAVEYRVRKATDAAKQRMNAAKAPAAVTLEEEAQAFDNAATEAQTAPVAPAAAPVTEQVPVAPTQAAPAVTATPAPEVPQVDAASPVSAQPAPAVSSPAAAEGKPAVVETPSAVNQAAVGDTTKPVGAAAETPIATKPTEVPPVQFTVTGNNEVMFSLDGGRLKVVPVTKYSPRTQSVVEFEVDETKRGQGIGTQLMRAAVEKYDDLGAQVSSLASLRIAYNAGMRYPDDPRADVAKLEKMRQDNGGSLFMALRDDRGNPFLHPTGRFGFKPLTIGDEYNRVRRGFSSDVAFQAPYEDLPAATATATTEAITPPIAAQQPEKGTPSSEKERQVPARAQTAAEAAPAPKPATKETRPQAVARIKKAFAAGEPVDAADIERLALKIPDTYAKDGDKYVKVVEKKTPAPAEEESVSDGKAEKPLELMTEQEVIDSGLRRGMLKHPQAVIEAWTNKKPILAKAWDGYNKEAPEGYVREGDLYVYRPEPPPSQEKQSVESVNTSPSATQGSDASGRGEVSYYDPLKEAESNGREAFLSGGLLLSDSIAEYGIDEGSDSEAAFINGWKAAKKEIPTDNKPEKMTAGEYVRSQVEEGPYAKEYVEDTEAAEARRSDALSEFLTIVENHLASGGTISLAQADSIFNTVGEERAHQVLRSSLAGGKINNGEYLPPKLRDSTKTYRQYLSMLNKDGVKPPNVAELYRKMLKRASERHFPLSVEGVEDAKLSLPSGYVREGDLYVFKPEPPPDGGGKKPAPKAAPSPAIAKGTRVVTDKLASGVSYRGEFLKDNGDGTSTLRAFGEKPPNGLFRRYGIDAKGVQAVREVTVPSASVRSAEPAADLSKLTPAQRSALRRAVKAQESAMDAEIAAGETEGADTAGRLATAEERRERERTDNETMFRTALARDGQLVADNAIVTAPGVRFRIDAYHGSPHIFDRFDLSRIGTGEGAQAYGYGLYFAQAEKVAEQYRDVLSGKPSAQVKIDGQDIRDVLSGVAKPVQQRVAILLANTNGDVQKAVDLYDYTTTQQTSGQGMSEAAMRFYQGVMDALESFRNKDVKITGGEGALYSVSIDADDEDMLDWDAPLSQQSEKVRAAFKRALSQKSGKDVTDEWIGTFGTSGEQLYNLASAWNKHDSKAASDMLRDAGIKGIRYLDAASRPSNIVSDAMWRTFDKNNQDVQATVDELMRGYYGTDADKRTRRETLTRELERGRTRNYVIFDDNIIRITKRNETPAKGYGERGEARFRVSRVTPAEDTAYMAAVERGDMDTAQRMVDEAAKGAGYTVEAWHGGAGVNPYTGKATTIFNVASRGRNGRESGAYFTTTKQAADDYRRAFDELTGEAGSGAVYHVFIDPTKAEFRYGVYDAPTIRDAWKKPIDVVVVRDPAQIKSADAITRDDAGNVIPLSERFNDATPDIRFRVDRAQTETPAFKAWFKDSKVVDADGKPLVVYHGTDKDFTAFAKTSDIGFHFGNPEQAGYRFGGNDNYGIVPAYLNLQNPLRLNDHAWDTPITLAQAIRRFDKEGRVQDAAQAWLDATQVTLDDRVEMKAYRGMLSEKRATVARLRDAAMRAGQEVIKSAGFDGVVYNNEVEGSGDSYIAFSPTQIKSATGNIGTFDPANPDIRFRTPRAAPSTDQDARDEQLRIEAAYGDTLTPTTLDEMTKEGRRSYFSDPQTAEMALLAGATPTNKVEDEARRMARDKFAVDAVTRKAVETGNVNDIATAKLGIWRWYERGTEIARSLRMRFDPVDTPEARRAYLARALFAPSDTEAVRLKRLKDSQDTQAMIEAMKPSAQRGLATLKKLKAMGMDFTKYTNAELMDDVKMNQTLTQIATTRAGWGDKIHEWWRNAILSAPTTQIVNVLGNAGNAGIEAFVQRPVEAVLNSFAKHPDAATFRSIGAMYRAIAPSIQLANKNFWKALASERTVTGPTANKLDDSNAAIGGVAGKTVRVPQRIMTATDEWFKTVFMAMLTADYATREFDKRLKNPDFQYTEADREKFVNGAMTVGSPSYNRAWEEALKWSFQQQTGTFAQGFSRLRNDPTMGFWVKFILPFVKTPANIVRTGLRKSPAYLLPYLYRASTGKIDTATAIKEGAEQLVAMALMATIWGMTKGDGDDELNRPKLTGTRKTGAQYRPGERESEMRDYPPMSIRFGDTWVSYARLEPLATMLATMADIMTAWDASKSGRYGDIPMVVFNSLKGNLRDKTFLSGVGDIIDIIENGDEQKLMMAGQRIVAGFNPNIVKATVRAFDPYVRDYRNREKGAAWLKTSGERFAQTVLPAAGIAPIPRFDIAGKPVEREGGPLYNLFVPFRVQSAARLTKVDAMLKRFNDAQADDADRWYPPPPKAPVIKPLGQKDPVPISDAEFEEYQRTAGELAAKRLANMSFRFDAPTQRDVDRVKEVYEWSRKLAKTRLQPKVLRRWREERRKT